jgi:hypothetical protein
MSDESGAPKKQEQTPKQPGGEKPAGKRKRKKPNFNKPFLVAGIALGIVSGLPFLNFANMILFAWAWIAGILAAKIFSGIYPKIKLQHGAIVGAIAGILGAVIATPLSAGSSWAISKWAFKNANAHEIMRNVNMPWKSGNQQQANLLNDVLLRWFPRPHHAFAIMSWNKVDYAGYYVDKKGTRLSDPESTGVPVRISAGTAVVRIVLHFLFLEVGFFIFGTVGGIIGASIYTYKPPEQARPPDADAEAAKTGAPEPTAAGPEKSV